MIDGTRESKDIEQAWIKVKHIHFGCQVLRLGKNLQRNTMNFLSYSLKTKGQWLVSVDSLCVFWFSFFLVTKSEKWKTKNYQSKNYHPLQSRTILSKIMKIITIASNCFKLFYVLHERSFPLSISISKYYFSECLLILVLKKKIQNLKALLKLKALQSQPPVPL